LTPIPAIKDNHSVRGLPAVVAVLLVVVLVAACGSSAPVPTSGSNSTAQPVAAATEQAPTDQGARPTIDPDATAVPAPTPEATPDSTPEVTPDPTPDATPPTDPPPAVDPGSQEPPVTQAVIASAKYAYSMYRPKTHAVQKTDWYCVPASIQMMLNLINGTSRRGEAAQTRYWRYAQDHSRYPIRDNGADAAGWAAAMRHWGAGNYTVGVHNTMQASLRAAAKRMRATGKPVGMIVWGRNRGHAWVMTGFRATADPKNTNDFAVTSVQAMGPLWPLGTLNGKSFDPGPKDWVSYDTLKKKFTEFQQNSAPDWDGRWLTVLP
jgi:peptidase C39-like protein